MCPKVSFSIKCPKFPINSANFSLHYMKYKHPTACNPPYITQHAIPIYMTRKNMAAFFQKERHPRPQDVPGIASLFH